MFIHKFYVRELLILNWNALLFYSKSLKAFYLYLISINLTLDI